MNTSNIRLAYVASQLTDGALLLQLAEECSELSAVISKYLRKMYTYNVSSKSKDEILQDLRDELADVHVALDAVLEKFPEVSELYENKLTRWCERLKSADDAIFESEIYESRCPYCAGDLRLYAKRARGNLSKAGYSVVVYCSRCIGQRELFVDDVSGILPAKDKLLKDYKLSQ